MIGQPPLVSVIVPCFNQGHFLAEALDSLIAQTYRRWECFVIDDGSTDNTRTVALSFTERDSRIKYLWQKNRGLSAARNRGLAEVRGAYIQFLDADDTLDRSKFATQVPVFARHPSIGVVYSDFVYFESKDPKAFRASNASYRERYGSADILAALLKGNFIVVHSAIVKADAAREVGGFDENQSRCEDFQFWLRVAALGTFFEYVPGVLAYYREVPASMSSSWVPQTLAAIRVLHRTGLHLARDPIEKRLVWKTISDMYARLAWFYSQSEWPWLRLFYLFRSKLAFSGDRTPLSYTLKGLQYVTHEIRKSYKLF